MPTRLPIPGSDEGQWGEILNQFLSVEHNDDGSLKSTGSLAAKANDNDVVKVAGNQTVGGVKTFSSAPSVPDESFAISKTAGLSSALASKYTLPGGGIPESDLATAVQTKLNATGGSGTPDDGSVTTDKLDDGAVTDEKVAVDASISQSKIANLTTDLSGKANSAHNHSWQDITTGTQPAPVSHGHTIADVTGLQDELTSLGDALDDKLEASDLTGYATTAALAGKANDGDVVKLSGDQAVAGTKTFSAIPVLPASDPSSANQATRKSYVDTALSGKSNTGHTHLSGDISGLDDTLDFLSSEVPRGHEVFYTGTEWPSRPSIIAPRYIAWDSMAHLDAPQPPEMINLDRWKPHPNSEVYDALA